MVIDKAKKIVLAVGTTMLPVSVAGALFAGSTNLLSPTHASAYTITLDNDNSPELTNGEGTNDIDEKGIIWEYHNASDNSNGHVTLGHQGYFGTTTSGYDYKGIDNVVANFTAGEGAELWLLSSYNGTDWKEVGQLTSGEPTTVANNWRYVRFYCWDESNNLVNVESVTLGYSCEGNTPLEDIDFAKKENVIATSDNITYDKETTEVSPNSNGGEAIKFTKTGGSSWMILGFGRTYVVKDIANKIVEFDFKTSNINYGKTVSLMLNTSTVGSTIDSSKHSSYKITNIQDDWYHVEIPISALSPVISGYKVDGKWQDVNTKINSEVNGIKINAGSCVIDNLRINFTSSSLGIFNNGTSFGINDAKPYWFKVSWVGAFHSCTFTFDNPIVEQVEWDNVICKAPFYLRGLDTGTVTVTATIVYGYNRQVGTISNTITVTEPVAEPAAE